MRDSERVPAPFSEWGGQERVGERIEVVEAGPILRIVLEFWFVIWLIRVWCDKKNWLPAVTSGYQWLPVVTWKTF